MIFGEKYFLSKKEYASLIFIEPSSAVDDRSSKHPNKPSFFAIFIVLQRDLIGWRG
jgi:hypothetical protein